LGQFYLRKRREAALFAIPPLFVLLLIAYEMRRGVVSFAGRFVDQGVCLAAIAIVVVVGVWRLVAVVHAFRCADERTSRQLVLDRLALLALAAVVVLSHAGAGYVLSVTYAADGHAFNPNHPTVIDLTTPKPSLDPGATQGPTPSPVVTPTINSRVTIVFTGFDADPSRGETLYDSLLVVSYDPKSNSVAMVSVPRDSTSFPLYYGDHLVVPTWLRINSVPTNTSKSGLNGSPDSPYMTLVNEISYLVGIHVDYYAAMDLGGFVKMIDAVGGIDVVNPAPIDDGYYDWLDGVNFGFALPAGPQHLDGKHALAYVRSRKSPGDNDFGRSSRQQEVLIALLHKMAQPTQLLNLPKLISTLGDTVTTNFPADQVANYLDIGQNVPKDNFKQYVLSPDQGYSEYLSNGALCLFNSKVAELSVQLFGKDSLWSGKTAENTCPANP
jgi:LCP family protein required for cell wall assembly